MRSRHLACVACLAVALSAGTAAAHAQGFNQEWLAYHNPPGSPHDTARGIAVDAGGFTYVTGTSGGASYIATAKYDPAGNLVWARTYRASDGVINNSGLDVAVDAAGNVYVAGAAYNAATADLDAALLKYGPDGTLAWADLYDGPATYHDQWRSLALDPAGNVLVAGDLCVRNDSVGGVTTYYLGVAKFAPDGSRLWVKTYTAGAGLASNTHQFASDVAVDASGNAVVTGTGSDGTSDVFATVAYGAGGAQLWADAYNHPGSTSETSYAVAVNAAGNAVVTGRANAAASNVVTVRYTAAGARAWVREYSSPGPKTGTVDYGYAVAIAADGTAVVAGSGDDGDGTAALVLKYLADGSLSWARYWNPPAGFSARFKAVALGPGGDVFAAGYRATNPYSEPLLARFSATGDLLATAIVAGPNYTAYDYDEFVGVAVDGIGNAYAAGSVFNGTETWFVAGKFSAAECVIGGQAMPDGTINPTNACQVCDTALDPAGWTDNDGASCADGLFCNGADTCRSGACAHAGNPCPAGERCDEPTATCEPSTAIDLVSFTATGERGAVEIAWETATEADNAGFHVWRADSETGTYARITDALVPSEGSPTGGASYALTDAEVAPRATYWYKLEDVDVYGNATFHGPVSATVPREPLFGCGMAEGGDGFGALALLVLVAEGIVARRRRGTARLSTGTCSRR